MAKAFSRGIRAANEAQWVAALNLPTSSVTRDFHILRHLQLV